MSADHQLHARALGLPLLPVELQVEIIDAHQHNFYQLRTMARVCHLWRNRCNKSLFRRLELKPSSIESFAALISSPFTCNSVLSSICHLWIGHHDDKAGDWSAFRVELLQEILISLSEARRLRDLTLLKSVSELFEVGFITILPMHLPYVQSLHLSDVHFTTSGEFAGFFNGFASVQYIVLKDVTVPNAYSHLDTMKGVTACPAVVCPDASRFTLSVHLNDDGTVRKCLRWKSPARGARITLRDVAILHSSSAVEPRAQNPRHGVHIGPDVSHIEILAKQSPSHEMWQFPSSRIDLAFAQSLRYITLGSTRCVLSLLSWVPALLAHIPTAAPLKEIRIAFSSSRQFDLDQPFIRWLASTISKGRKPFGGLEAIHFMAFGTLGDKNIEEKIVKTVSKEFWDWEEDRVGVLRFSFVP
ncbi:hypothetical protein D9611_001183 [Ephemerocybe angulata]|uniref:Uncharacterized protein n=1 Tax=Ephemerocybe angulata TaxID=980116 RepID=A0A8H5FM20_9AGAR|nr:hypothetical protein D9611_001183 [Tulosesus angulatus]